MFAHFYNAPKKTFVLIISATVAPVGTEYPVANKREARKLAKELGAKCWNF